MLELEELRKLNKTELKTKSKEYFVKILSKRLATFFTDKYYSDAYTNAKVMKKLTKEYEADVDEILDKAEYVGYEIENRRPPVLGRTLKKVERRALRKRLKEEEQQQQQQQQQ